MSDIPQTAAPTGGVTYQTTVLTPTMVETLIKDDSPAILYDSENVQLWQFLGVDIPVADIREWDFKNIEDMIDLAFLNMLENYPESQHERVFVVEYENMEVNGETKLVPVRKMKAIELWHAVRAKVYVKMCRARNGFTMRGLTESRQFLKEETNAPMFPTMPVQAKKKKRWGIF